MISLRSTRPSPTRSVAAPSSPCYLSATAKSNGFPPFVPPPARARGTPSQRVVVGSRPVRPRPGSHPRVGDPRAPSAPVPACVKWLNDELDSLPSLSVRYPAAALTAQVDNAHLYSIAGLRAMPGQSAIRIVTLAACQATAQPADEWDG